MSVEIDDDRILTSNERMMTGRQFHRFIARVDEKIVMRTDVVDEPGFAAEWIEVTREVFGATFDVWAAALDRLEIELEHAADPLNASVLSGGAL